MMQGSKIQALLGLALCLPLLAVPAWARDTFRLDSVDFISTNGRTHIIMHTGSMLPVQKVMVSDSKLVLDIDRVDADESVRTNFSGAGNVSHVILKPLNEHKIRMIIRGENLGAPVVAFNSPVAHDVGHLPAASLPEDLPAGDLQAETDAALQALQEEGMQNAALTAGDHGAETGAAADSALLMAEEDPLVSEGEILLDPAAATPEAQPDPGPIFSLGAEAADLAGGNSVSRFFDAAAGGKFNQYIPYGLLALLLAGSGLFLKHKIASLRNNEPSLEDLMTEQAGGRKVGFREMANAYRQQDDVRKSAHPGQRGVLAQNKSNLATRPAGRKPDELIGLRSLNKATQAEPGSRQAQYLESLLASASAPPPPVKAPAPKKQAVNQYLKAQGQPPVRKPKSRQAADERMAEEMKRAQDIQQTLAARKPAPKPGVSSPRNPINRAPVAKSALASKPGGTAAALSGADLPAGQNQEVLDFLRNVADLMAKDGRPEVARNIQRNLNTL